MFKFPGEKNTNLLLKNDKPLFYEPIPKIGLKVLSRVIKVTPYHAYLRVTHIEDIKTHIEYKAVIRHEDLKERTESGFVVDVLQVDDIVKAMIISFGDHNGLVLSTSSENLGIVKN